MSESKAAIEKMKGELAELREELSRQRKKGGDVFIAQLKISALPAKLKMAEATQSESDIAAAKKLLNNVRAELKASSSTSQEENFKTDGFNKVKDYIERAKEAVRLDKKEEAKVLYTYAREHYALLSPEQKKQIVQQLSSSNKV